ncbi:facilitated trehalose transporter Tret1-like [Schistocerca nitens]|uniref:facilitated trehalose transporter Tret1-like n=1 Tax=Schistocerca nitens TaxID=7011 RepID=UPI00211929F4|nr:facilitated trehalose transporter Tret1-like [Schistocerca nitens]
MEPRMRGVLMQFAAATSAVLMYMSCGVFIGWTSPVLPYLQGASSHIPMSPAEASWLVSTMSLAMAAAVVPSVVAVERLGRKTALLLCAPPLLASWLMVALAQDAALLFVARALGSVSVGVAFMTTPMYLGEIAEDRLRGAVTTLYQVLLNVGTLYSYAVGAYVSFATLAWACLAPPLAFAASFIWMPESPYFLAMRGRDADAERSLMRLRGAGDPKAVEQEMKRVLQTVEEHKSSSVSPTLIFTDPTHRRALIYSICFILLQSSSGVMVLVSYAADIFARSGAALDASVSSMVLGAVQTAMSAVAAAVVDRAGRRPMLLVSCAGCTVSLAAVGAYFYLANTGADVSSLGWLPLSALVVYVVFNSLGIGPLTWVVPAELLHPSVKGVGTCLMTVVLGLYGFAVMRLFQVVADAPELGEHVAFWAFAVCCALGFVFVLLVLPETKGKSFLQIQQELQRKANSPG